MMHYAKRAGFLAAAAMLAVSAPADAQQTRTINVPATKKWQHAATGLIVPQSLAGLPRTEISDSTAEELDVFLQFGDANATALTVYIFRATLTDVPVWFDRAETQILTRSAVFGSATPRGDAIAFVPPGATTASALRRVYVPGKSPYTATGVAMLPFGGWLVAARLSSTTLDPAALDAKLVEALAGLTWPAPAADATPAPAAVPVQPCATPLQFAKKAKLKKPDMSMSLIGALLAAVPPDAKVKKTAVDGPKGFCREGAPTQAAGAYRALGGGAGYLIAAGDAGRTIDVYPEILLDKGEPGYAVTFHDLSTSFVFPTFEKLPAPEQVMAMMGKTRPISSSARGKKEVNINIAQ